MSYVTDGSPVIAILGGTGKLGYGLALRWAAAGLPVTIGSRDVARAREAAGRVEAATGNETVLGHSNLDAASQADFVVFAVPFVAHEETVRSVSHACRRKIVVDATVPLVPPKVGTVQLPECRAAALRTQEILGPETRVNAAFHHISAGSLSELGRPIDCDVLVCGNDRGARSEVAKLATRAGLSAVEAGPLANSVALESLTPLLIWMNRHYGAHGAGIRITGLPDRRDG